MENNFIKKQPDSPPFLTKFLKEERDAANFLMGNIIIRKIEVFRDIECGRRDETENSEHSKYKVGDGIVDCQRTYINQVYILCTSGPHCDLEKCLRNFGMHTILIENVDEFRKRLSEKWKSFEMSLGAVFYDVVYDKGEEIEAPPYLMSPHGTSLWQKKREYAYENEYRFIFKCKMDPKYHFKDEMELKIGDIKDIARMEERNEN